MSYDALHEDVKLHINADISLGSSQYVPIVFAAYIDSSATFPFTLSWTDKMSHLREENKIA